MTQFTKSKSLVVVATSLAIISSVAPTSAQSVALYDNIPDPLPQTATSADLHPTNNSVSWMSGQPFVTGELGIVASVSLPVAISGALTGVLHFEIWDNNAIDEPGQKVASVGDIDLDSWTGANLEYQMVRFDRPVTGLAPNTKYYLVVDASGPNISGFERTYFIPGSANSEGTNNAGKFQVIVNGTWRFASDFRGADSNYKVMEILEVSPPPPLNVDIATATSISWDSQAETTYVLQSSPDLQNWTVAVHSIEGTGERLTHFFIRSDAASYYRVIATPTGNPE